jgi:hypothetical protein
MPRVNKDPRLNWCRMDGTCITCDSDDWCSDYGPRTLVVCTSCQLLGTHVECYKQVRGAGQTAARADAVMHKNDCIAKHTYKGSQDNHKILCSFMHLMMTAMVADVGTPLSTGHWQHTHQAVRGQWQ